MLAGTFRQQVPVTTSNAIDKRLVTVLVHRRHCKSSLRSSMYSVPSSDLNADFHRPSLCPILPYSIFHSTVLAKRARLCLPEDANRLMRSIFWSFNSRSQLTSAVQSCHRCTILCTPANEIAITLRTTTFLNCHLACRGSG